MIVTMTRQSVDQTLLNGHHNGANDKRDEAHDPNSRCFFERFIQGRGDELSLKEQPETKRQIYDSEDLRKNNGIIHKISYLKDIGSDLSLIIYLYGHGELARNWLYDMNKARTSSSEGATRDAGSGRKNMAEKERFLLAKDGRNSPRYEIVVGLGVYGGLDVQYIRIGRAQNALASWVRERLHERSLCVAGQVVIPGKRLRIRHNGTGVPEIEFEMVAVVSGDLGKLYNEPGPDADVDLEEEIMNMLKSLTRRLAKDLGGNDAELSYGNLKCSLE